MAVTFIKSFNGSTISDRFLTLWDYLKDELTASDFDTLQELKRERVTNFLAIPFAIEKVTLGLKSIITISSGGIDDNYTSRGGSDKKSKKLSKKTIILSATLDIALAGMLIGWIYKKPTATKIQIGVGSIGLLSLYGAQW
ncbi:4893_t:CDS:2 [Entrophospora sp. SA101]|nr:4893_t:CDS:2 [Entrophospora sp. SA101]